MRVCLRVCLYTVDSALRVQKRESYPLKLELQVVSYKLPYLCSELNLGPLQEQQMLLPAEPSLEPHIWGIFIELCIKPLEETLTHCV